MFYKNKIVAVIGGGNTAIDDALYLSDIASRVYIIQRREEFKDEINSLERLKEKDNVEFIYNSNVSKLVYDDKLNGIEITNKNGNIKHINIDGLFIDVGRIPENQNFASIINLDDNGYVIAGEDCNTNVKGIFTAGDNRTKLVRQLVTAASDGAVAATEVIKYLNNK
jgi:thioredoxin reductase (NADPH)